MADAAGAGDYATVWLHNVEQNYYLLSTHTGAFSEFVCKKRDGKPTPVWKPPSGPKVAFGFMDTRGGDGQVFVAVIDLVNDRHHVVCPPLKVEFGDRHVGGGRVQLNDSAPHPAITDKQAATILFDIVTQSQISHPKAG